MNEMIGCRDGSADGYRKKLFLNLVVLLLAALYLLPEGRSSKR